MIEVTVIRDAAGTVRLTDKEIKSVISRVSRGEGIEAAELAIVLVHDRRIRILNKHFLHHDYVTDVITFPLEEKKVHAEIYINVQQAVRQARMYGVTVRNEMIRLIVHGTLHAFGYDDTAAKSRAAMERVQERYVSEAG